MRISIARKKAAFDEGFLGAAPISQAVLFNANPTGKNLKEERWQR